MKKLLVLFALLHGLCQAQSNLVLVGGGQHPPEAMKALYDWTGKPEPHILVIGWASSVPDENLRILVDDYAQYAHRPQLELAARDQATVLAQLERADGVWFTGGDQTKVMQVLQDRTLLQALRDKFQNGTVFGGTSAGCAIMSRKMLTGNADLTVIDPAKVEIAEGLGLLPENIIVDQHFLRRQRENRLLGALLGNPGHSGIGVDEDTALLLSNGIQARVVGRAQLMLLTPDPPGLRLRLYQPGDRFQL
ncbi:cyanophycinase [bacterium SCN 62-11]|nr:cyanophycinase [Candidatus Eremiobacteraeota bacterium]ODT67217.1 MAG: cyanophycinase [bacterium SCN 62-11]